MDLFLTVYLLGCVLVFGILTLILYRQYNSGEDINLNEIVAYVISPFLSWLMLVFMLCVLINMYSDEPIIKGKK
jgi:L-asparagine transporter-like permease